jgi:hypothetical protein
MDTVPSTLCRHHVWERRLEMHDRLERVVRICVHCNRLEVCWEQRERRQNERKRLTSGVQILDE